jgi:hypothetical protein
MGSTPESSLRGPDDHPREREAGGVWAIDPEQSQSASLTIDPFVGYRLWRLVPAGRYGDDPGDPILTSATTNTIWEGARQIAGCRTRLPIRVGRSTIRPHPERPAPALDCRCGIYAMKHPMRPPRPWMWAHGAVELSGMVFEGSRGFRAGRARIIGPLEIIVGTGSRPECLKPLCPRPAEWIRIGPTLYLPRCRQHLEPPGSFVNLPLTDFLDRVAASFAVRYGVTIKEQ